MEKKTHEHKDLPRQEDKGYIPFQVEPCPDKDCGGVVFTTIRGQRVHLDTRQLVEVSKMAGERTSPASMTSLRESLAVEIDRRAASANSDDGGLRGALYQASYFLRTGTWPK
jgi:hypothetical protein